MSVKKEMLLLKRDFGGVVILFIMPLVLIFVVTLIQERTFSKTNNAKIPIVVVDNDKGKVSQSIFDNLTASDIFTVVTKLNQEPLTEKIAKEAVFKGRYQLAIVIPENLTSDLQAKIDENVNTILSTFGLEDTLVQKPDRKIIGQKTVNLYFDPAVQMSFKNAVMSNIDKMISQIETKSIYTTFQAQLGEDAKDSFDQKSFIAFKEIVPRVGNTEIKPNSVQHNVPAWSLFAMFFIVIPLSINIVKEKLQGTFVRLRTNPVSYATVLAGKTITYTLICMIQFYMMVAVAIFIFPKLGLPALNVEGNLIMLSIVALFSAFAAVGYGILLGTIAKTQEQSAPFGATSVIVLAAIGGVWVPVFAMPPMMQILARCSPMNWGLNAFYDVFLRHASFPDILPEISLLLLFFAITVGTALLYDKKKRAV